MNDRALRYENFGISHEGRVRSLNEDRFLMAPRSGIWAVADGMGGHDAGELASASIVEQLSTLGVASSAPDLRARAEHRLSRANAQIQEIAAARGAGTIGSTVAILLAFERQFACLWVGDSRLYLLRGGVLSQVSRDHTEVQELFDRGVITREEARTWPRRNVITRAVGVAADVVPDIELGATEPGDVFILGTDGLTGHVLDEEIAGIVAGSTPEAACNTLLDLVLERGGTDNVTIVIVKCHVSQGETVGDHPFAGNEGLDIRHVR